MIKLICYKFIFLTLLFCIFYFQIKQKEKFIIKDGKIKYFPLNLVSKQLPNKWVHLSEIDSFAITKLLELEDKNFINHFGYSLTDIQVVVLDSIMNQKKLRGASTITQQLARTLFLNLEKSFQRKITEIQIANDIEESFSKNEILELYLNTVYWGHGKSGIVDAANYYFNIPPKNLKQNQISALILILKKPNFYSQKYVRELSESL